MRVKFDDETKSLVIKAEHETEDLMLYGIGTILEDFTDVQLKDVVVKQIDFIGSAVVQLHMQGYHKEKKDGTD